MTTLNGTGHPKTRKSLALQLDRFDQMLDGLAEAIPEVVADTVRQATAQAVREAVEAAVAEVLANATLREQLSPHTQPVAAPAPVVQPKRTWQRVRRLWQGLRCCITQWTARGRQPLHRLQTYGLRIWQQCGAGIAKVAAQTEWVSCFKTELSTALVVGMAVAAVAWYAEPWLAALLSGIGGFGSTLAFQAGLWLRRLLSAAQES